MRIKRKETSVYHCISHVAGRELLLDEEAREVFELLLFRVAGFSGVEVLAFCALPDRIHVLVRVPEDYPIDDKELLRRYSLIYGDGYAGVFPSSERLAGILADPEDPDGALWRNRLRPRMHDISAFMKTLKQRFSWWYNRRQARTGPLWRERFRAVIVDSGPEGFAVTAAFIDLMAVRWGLVEDPADYPWCSYGAAIRGNEAAQAGLTEVVGARSWKTGEPDYRTVLYGEADAGTAGSDEDDRGQEFSTSGFAPGIA